MTPRQFTALCERWRLADRRENIRTAQVMALIANVNRDPKKRNRPYTVNDFLPRERGAGAGTFDDHAEHQQQTPEEQAMILARLAAAFSGGRNGAGAGAAH